MISSAWLAVMPVLTLSIGQFPRYPRIRPQPQIRSQSTLFWLLLLNNLFDTPWSNTPPLNLNMYTIWAAIWQPSNQLYPTQTPPRRPSPPRPDALCGIGIHPTAFQGPPIFFFRSK